MKVSALVGQNEVSRVAQSLACNIRSPLLLFNVVLPGSPLSNYSMTLSSSPEVDPPLKGLVGLGVQLTLCS